MWNFQDWMWEERNRMNEAREHLLRKMNNLNHDRFLWRDINVEGDAFTNVKKGKLSLDYDLSMAGRLVDKLTQESWPFRVGKILPTMDEMLVDLPLAHRSGATPMINKALEEFRQEFEKAEWDTVDQNMLKENLELDKKNKAESKKDSIEKTECELKARKHECPLRKCKTAADSVTEKIRDQMARRRAFEHEDGRLEYIPIKSSIHGNTSETTEDGNKKVDFNYKAKVDWECLLKNKSNEIVDRAIGKTILDHFNAHEKPIVTWQLDTSKSENPDKIKKLVSSRIEPQIEQELGTVAQLVMANKNREITA